MHLLELITSLLKQVLALCHFTLHALTLKLSLASLRFQTQSLGLSSLALHFYF
jgi:hypothetical protein